MLGDFSRTANMERLDEIIVRLGGLLSGVDFEIFDVDLTTARTDTLMGKSGKSITLLSTLNRSWSFKLVVESTATDSGVVGRVDMQNMSESSLRVPFTDIKFTNVASSGSHAIFLIYK